MCSYEERSKFNNVFQFAGVMEINPLNPAFVSFF